MHFEKLRNNLKETWKSINKLLGKRKVNACCSVEINNQLCTDPFTITIINDHFTSVAKKLTDNLPSARFSNTHYLKNSCVKSMYLNPTTNLEKK